MKHLQSTFILGIMNSMVIDLPVPLNVSYLWNTGSLLGLALVTQILTGIAIAVHFIPCTSYGFDSIDSIIRDVHWGAVIRSFHVNGASMALFLVFLHFLRALTYGSYLRATFELWTVGVISLILFMAIAFLGYILPWGQMSFWGLTVISSMITSIPYYGTDLLTWALGGPSISETTYARVWILHIVLPLALAGLSILHMAALHIEGSNNPLGINSGLDKVTFHSFFSSKDLLGFIFFFIVLGTLALYYPEHLSHSDNWIEADPLTTPPHIVPEWYFLPFYAMLRSCSSKLLGIIIMASSLLVLFILPWVNLSFTRSRVCTLIGRLALALLVVSLCWLTYLGACSPEYPYVLLAKIGTWLYFISITLNALGTTGGALLTPSRKI